MTSYNQLNGVQTQNSYWLLETVVRGQWGFNGFFVTDWGGVQNGSPNIEAGCDMQQNGNSGSALRTWLNASGITEIERTRRLERVKDAVRNILKWVVKAPSFIGTYDDLTTTIVNNRSYDFYTNPDSPYEESKAKAYEIATGGIVLMKNENNALPRTGPTRFAIVSSSIARTYSARTATYSDPGCVGVYDLLLQGGGSGHVYFADAITLRAALEEKEGFSVPYAAVETDISSNAAAEAEKAVATTDVGIMIFSRTTNEGSDVATTVFTLSTDEARVLNAFGAAYKAAGKPFICLINQGANMSTTEMNANADTILQVWLPGSQGPRAVASIISGEVNPSGKLAQSFPILYTDSPSIIAGNPNRNPVNSWGTNPVFYDEGVFAGYRYFDTFGSSRVAYHFGHGLSYTTFEYSDLKLSSRFFKGTDESIKATVKVTNTGDVAGREVVQLYVGANTYKAEGRPIKELRDYGKTKLLQPGESEVLELTISKRDLQFFDDGEDPMGLVLTGSAGSTSAGGRSNVVYDKGPGWTVKAGTVFTVTVGGTSDSAILAENGVTGTFIYGIPFNVTAIDGEFVATTVNDSASESIGFSLFIAVYSETGKLVSIETTDIITVAPGNIISYIFENIKPAGYPADYVFKAFCWDADFIPLFDAVVVK